MYLAGDIGGTKTNLGLFANVGNELVLQYETSFPSRAYTGLETIVTEFIGQLREKGHDTAIAGACMGVAGAVQDGECVATNLPWVISAHSLGRTLGLPRVALLNDLEITAHGIGELKPHEMVTLNQGQAVPGNTGLIAAGTGLGVGCLFWDGQKLIPSASEGGHVDFAPRNQMEIGLLQFLLRQHDHVSVERIVSGMGMPSIYQYLVETGFADEMPEIRARLATQDNASVISQAALAGECHICVKALDLFVEIYGATAGNLALTIKALGGVFIGGGIAPKIIDKMRDGTFMGAFLDKGRFTSLLAGIPVKVILNDKTALRGAARVAVNSAAR
ncbi:MAG: glucokinase [Blastocatellia bacterium]